MGLFDTIFGSRDVASQKTNMRNYPEWAAGFAKMFGSLGPDVLTRYQPGGGQLGAAGNAALLSTVRGENLGGNPALDRVADAISRTSTENLNRSLAQIGRNANLAGVPYSSRVPAVQGRAARLSNQDLLDQLSRLYAGNYAQERAYQVGAVPAAIGAGNQDLALALEILNALRGLETKGKGQGLTTAAPSPYSVYRQIVEQIAGAITGGMGGGAGPAAGGAGGAGFYG